MRARYYDPQVGRFTSEDPAMFGENFFSYCDGDPANLSDSSGRLYESYLSQAYGWLKLGMSYFYSAMANPELKIKNIAKIKALAEKLIRLGNTAEVLGEAEMEMSTMTAEEADHLGGFAGLGLDLAQAQGSLGAGTMSIKALCRLAAQQLLAFAELLE